MPLRALCLDFDGVIADTENHHVAAWQRTLGSLGWEVDDQLCARSLWQDDRSFLAELFQSRGVVGGDVEGWVRRKQELTKSLLADAPRVYPGVPELIRTVSARIPVAVVTTTWRENARAVLGTVGLLDRIALIVAKEDVDQPKPHPEPYEEAVRRLGFPAGEVVAIEDTDSGMASALGAGLRVLLVGEAATRHAPSERVLVLRDARGGPAHLGDVGRVLNALGWSDSC
ncbi:MAG: HAD family hydrolase [Isosphaeraceae bacterium]